MNGLLFETVRSCVAGNSFECCISLRGYRLTRFVRKQIRPFGLARFHRSKSASILISPVIKSRNGASLQPYFGEELSVLTLRKKHSFLKGQVKRIQARFTYLNSLLWGFLLRRRGAPWWRILTK